MADATALFLYILSSMGATILIVWPADGPGAWLRERVLRRVVPVAIGAILDCYVCLSVWIAVAGVPFWWFAGYRWSGIAWLVVPAVFWLVMPEARSGR